MFQRPGQGKKNTTDSNVGLQVLCCGWLGDSVYQRSSFSYVILYAVLLRTAYAHPCCVCKRTHTSAHSVCAVNNTNSIIFRGSLYLLPMGDLNRHRTQSSLLSVGALNRHQDCMPEISVGVLTHQDNCRCR
jgi:hypothetical protein